MGNQNSSEERFMRAALAEARRGAGATAPNPTVGAVIVRNGRILARGYHRRAGEPHAEVEALRALPRAEMARGATMYVTLEPCSTKGRTPPCTEAIIKAGIHRVIFGATDPNPKNRGRAGTLLQAGGVEVLSGVLGGECEALNEAWNHWISTGYPMVTAKAGLSLDGRLQPPPGRRWITSEAARADAMHLRAAHDAVLVGGATVRADNPRLTVRGVRGARQPVPVVWTRSGDIPPDSHLVRAGKVRVFKGMSLKSCLRQLAREGVQSVLIEGGGRTLGEAFDRGLVQRVVFYMAPVLIGGPVPAVGGRGCALPGEGWLVEDADYGLLGGDLRISGRVVPASAKQD